MFDDKTPDRRDPAEARSTSRKDDTPATKTRKDDAEATEYHYTDWALI